MKGYYHSDFKLIFIVVTTVLFTFFFFNFMNNPISITTALPGIVDGVDYNETDCPVCSPCKIVEYSESDDGGVFNAGAFWFGLFIGIVGSGYVLTFIRRKFGEKRDNEEIREMRIEREELWGKLTEMKNKVLRLEKRRSDKKVSGRDEKKPARTRR